MGEEMIHVMLFTQTKAQPESKKMCQGGKPQHSSEGFYGAL